MSRIRTIKPEFWTNEDLSALPEATHMLAAALLNYSDDEGYFNANLGLVKAACSPLREPSVSIHDSLNSLVSIGYLKLGMGADGKRYGCVVKFDDHQRVNRPTPSKIKVLQIAWDVSVISHAQITERSLPEGKGTGKGKEQGKGQASPLGSRLPADWLLPEPWRAWAKGERQDLDVERTAADFADYWHVKPGKDGRKTDWQATWRRWVRSQRGSDGRIAPPQPAPLPRLQA